MGQQYHVTCMGRLASTYAVLAVYTLQLVEVLHNQPPHLPPTPLAKRASGPHEHALEINESQVFPWCQTSTADQFQSNQYRPERVHCHPRRFALVVDVLLQVCEEPVDV